MFKTSSLAKHGKRPLMLKINNELGLSDIQSDQGSVEWNGLIWMLQNSQPIMFKALFYFI